MTDLVKRIIGLVLTGYHRGLSPLLPSACRFFPSCSVYASDAIQKYGILRGAYLCLRRLLRCHPWNRGGYDPVH